MSVGSTAGSFFSVRDPILGQTSRGQERIETEVVIHRSRFIGCAAQVHTKEEVTDFIKTRKAIHPQANHHVWAYVIDARSGAFHFSDDGEPGGTAGAPVFGVLSKYRLEKTALVVTRYFGGIKLGISGLIEAYRRSAEETVMTVGIVRYRLYRRYACALAYHDWKGFRHFLSALDIPEIGITVRYTEKVEILVSIAEEKASRLREELDRYVGMRKITGYSEGEPGFAPDESEADTL